MLGTHKYDKTKLRSSQGGESSQLKDTKVRHSDKGVVLNRKGEPIQSKDGF